MGGRKQNPVLAAFEAKLEAVHKQRLKFNNEISMIALLFSANNELKVGPGRSGFLLAEYLDTKMDVAKAFVDDDDPEMLHTKKEIAIRLRTILGNDNWMKYRELFTFVRDYWDVEV